MNVKALFTAFAATVLFSCAAHALPIADFTGSVTAGSPTQSGRLSRNGVPQTWTGQESYPGAINLTTTYNYLTYSFASWMFTGAPYVNISVDDSGGAGTFFVSAYSGSYDPSNKSLNWLGDEGQSGDYVFYSGTPGNARYFEIVLPDLSNLVLVVNTTAASGVGAPYEIAVNAFADTQYSDPAVTPTPEPSTLLMVGTGALGILGTLRRRISA